MNKKRILIIKFYLSYLDDASSLAWKTLEDDVLDPYSRDFLLQLGLLEIIVFDHLLDELLRMRGLHKADSATTPASTS